MTEKKWYENKDVVDQLKVEFEKAGLPLEYRARKVFEDNGFEAWSSHYKVPVDDILDTSIVEKEGIWRQIDIITMPKEGSRDVELQFDEIRIVLTIDFLAECKFSSKKSFFLFKSNDNFITNFPSNIWGNNLLPFKSTLYDSDKKESLIKGSNPTDYFNFDVYENVVEVNVSKLEIKKDNYDDRITYQACEQLFYATNYENLHAKYDMKEEKEEGIYASQLFKKWNNYLRENGIKKEEAIDWRNQISDTIALKFLRDNFELTDIKFFHMIFLTFPVLIINEGAGLFEVQFDDKNNITGFKKIKYGIYNHISQKSKNPLHHTFYPDDLGIIICDISYLKEVIDIVSKGLNKLGGELKKIIDENPYLIGYELLFNPEIMDPNDLFL